jgi:tetratricopeptide (TPR) repeat protein
MKHQSFFSLSLVLLLFSCSEQQNLTTSSQSALKLYQQGVRLYDEFYYAEAKASFDSALVFDSTFAMAWGRLASLNFDTKDERAARKNMAVALHHSHDATQREQLYIRFWDRRIQFDDLGAAKVADSLLRLYPHEAEPYVMRGLLFETRKNLDSAIILYNEASRIDTGYARAIMLLGYAYSTTGDHDRAISHMERYIRLAPDVADPRASFADLLLRVGRYDEALAQYRKSLELKSDYWYALNQIGFIYTILGRLRDAEAQFDRGWPSFRKAPRLRLLA